MPTKTEEKPAEQAPAFAFVSRPITELPKRETPRTEPDLATAKALLEIVAGTTEIDGAQVANTATDGQKYTEAKDARQAANKAKRLLDHVVPEGKVVKTRTYGALQDGKQVAPFEWAVYLADAKAESENGNGTEAAPAQS